MRKNCSGDWEKLLQNYIEQFIQTVRERKKIEIGILLPKLFWPTMRKNCSSDGEKLLKFEAEGREFAKFLR